MDLLETVAVRKIGAGVLAKHGVKLREKAGLATEPQEACPFLLVLGDARQGYRAFLYVEDQIAAAIQRGEMPRAGSPPATR